MAHAGRAQGLSLSWGAQAATAEESQTRPAKHLAFQHLQTIAVALDWAGTPGEGDPGFDGRLVALETLR